MKSDTSTSVPAYLCLVDVVQVSHPTGVKLASSCSEGPCFLETNTDRMVQFHLQIRGLQFETSLPWALSPKERCQSQPQPARWITRSWKYLSSFQNSLAPAYRRQPSRMPQGDRHPVPACGEDVSTSSPIGQGSWLRVDA